MFIVDTITIKRILVNTLLEANSLQLTLFFNEFSSIGSVAVVISSCSGLTNIPCNLPLVAALYETNSMAMCRITVQLLNQYDEISLYNVIGLIVPTGQNRAILNMDSTSFVHEHKEK